MESKKATYRNAVRSRQLIHNAFLQLLRKKDLSNIHVKEVVELANISKGTFYAHYKGIWEVLREVEDECLSSMFKVFNDPPEDAELEDFLPLFLCGLEEIEKERDIFLILFRSSGGDAFLSRVRKVFLEYMIKKYTHDDAACSLEDAHGFLTFVAGGALTLIRDWIESTDRVPSEQVARFLNLCITQGVGVLEHSDRTDALCP